MSKRILACLAMATAMVASAAADDELAFGVEGVRVFSGFIPSGGDVSLTYTGFQLYEPGVTKLYLEAGGGYEDRSIVRDLMTGDPYVADASGYEYRSPNFQWELAFIQGLSRRDDGKNLVEAFAYYRGRYDDYLTEADGLSDAVFADIGGLFGTSVMGGLSYDSVSTSGHKQKTGLYAEATAEWAPGFLNALTDFWRVSAQARYFVPLYDMESDGGNLLNLYAGFFAGVDYADGGSVPIYVNQSFGGRNLRGSVGDCVRGYGWNKFDSSLKAASSAELRLVGPAIVIADIVPVLFGFVDAGYYRGYSESTTRADADGLLASAGGGLAIDVFGFAQLSFIVGARLVDDELGYQYSGFLGAADAFYGIKFFLHF